jgi:hypothetical protein
MGVSGRARTELIGSTSSSEHAPVHRARPRRPGRRQGRRMHWAIASGIRLAQTGAAWPRWRRWQSWSCGASREDGVGKYVIGERGHVAARWPRRTQSHRRSRRGPLGARRRSRRPDHAALHEVQLERSDRITASRVHLGPFAVWDPHASDTDVVIEPVLRLARASSALASASAAMHTPAAARDSECVHAVDDHAGMP